MPSPLRRKPCVESRRSCTAVLLPFIFFCLVLLRSSLDETTKCWRLELRNRLEISRETETSGDLCWLGDAEREPSNTAVPLTCTVSRHPCLIQARACEILQKPHHAHMSSSSRTKTCSLDHRRNKPSTLAVRSVQSFLTAPFHSSRPPGDARREQSCTVPWG